MNARQLIKLGVPHDCLQRAIEGIQSARTVEGLRGNELKARIRQVITCPAEYVGDPHFGPMATGIVADEEYVPSEPVDYRTWGAEEIDDGAHAQMRQACSVPHAFGGAMMADAHIGYGLPIGGVLATEDVVIPYAVGVDIACRMKLSILDMPMWTLKDKKNQYIDALERGTRFGVGCKHEKPQDHAVLDADWTVSRITRENKDRARNQLGTSGSGNHFVEFGTFSLPVRDDELGLDAGEYVALLSHSGSRGTGAAVCSTYSDIARAKLPRRYEEFGRLAWLELDSQEGREYWDAMNLMGDYAAANHDVIHRLVSKLLGGRIVSGVENHHNFAWKEIHDGKEVVVHRKGATPAATGELGVIPGSMADPAYVVRGKGNAESLRSASHGAGRRMSRKKAKETFNYKAVRNSLAKRGVTILSAGADEVPGVYKNIEDVMQRQSDLVEIVGRFDPKIVKMCGDGSRAED